MKRWTIEEEAVLLKAVEDSKDNLDMAFRAASELINRTPAACAARWKKIKDTTTVPSYTMMSYSRNKKTKQLEIPFQEKVSWWCKAKIIIKKWFKK